MLDILLSTTSRWAIEHGWFYEATNNRDAITLSELYLRNPRIIWPK